MDFEFISSVYNTLIQTVGAIATVIGAVFAVRCYNESHSDK